jgi:ubiquinone/menaquinone biosynthesis C-methylase UbiE
MERKPMKDSGRTGMTARRTRAETTPDAKQRVRDQFGPAAARYAVSDVHVGGPDLTAMLRAVALTGRERLLDVGTGAGHTALAFAPRVTEVVALDLTEAMLEQTRIEAERRGLDNLRCQLGDAEALPFATDSFDLVTSRLAAHHFPRAEVAAAEMARVLCPGGSLLLEDSMAPEDPAQDTFFNTIELLRDPSHVRNYTPSQWLRMLSGCGIEAEVLGRWGLYQDFNQWVERTRAPQTSVAELRRLFDAAPADVREALALDTRGTRSLSVPCVLIRGRLGS